MTERGTFSCEAKVGNTLSGDTCSFIKLGQTRLVIFELRRVLIPTVFNLVLFLIIIFSPKQLGKLFSA